MRCQAGPAGLLEGENISARIVERENARIFVEPDDVDGFLNHAISLLSQKQLRRTMGHNARRYAETAFEIERITDGFEGVVEPVCAQPPARSGSRS